MKIIVLIKQVPDTTNVRINPETNTLMREGVESIINPFDMYALEEALRLKDRLSGEPETVVLSMGPPQVETALREAIAMGFDKAILLSDRKFAGSDTLATSYTLSSAIRKLGDYHLILAGKQAIDGDTAQVGPGIAARLGCTQLTLVDRVEEVDVRTKRVKVRRRLEGRHEIVSAPLPAMIAVLREINTPRYPTVPSRLFAADARIDLWDNKVMGIDEQKIGLKGSATQVRKIFSPERTRGEIIGHEQDDPDEVARRLIDTMMEKDLLSF